MKYTTQQITDLAKIWYNNKTQHNAGAVIVAMDMLLHWIVSRRQHVINDTRIEKEDLFQEACIGVILALNKYDGERSFTSYASYWIMQRINKHINNEISILKYPSGMSAQKMRSRYRKLMETLKNEDHTLSTRECHEMIAQIEGVPLAAVEAHGHRAAGCVYIGDSYDGNEDSDLGTNNSVDPTESIIKEIDRKKCLSVFDKITSKMSSKKRYIVHNCILGDESENMQSIADRQGVSRQRIQQIESKARKHIINRTRIELGI